LLLAVSFMFPYLFGLGSLLLWLCRRDELVEGGGYDRLQLLGTALVFGILLNHLAVLSLPTLGQAMLLSALVSASGFAFWVVTARQKILEIFTSSWVVLLPALYLGCLLFVLMEPIDGWDARSIWFFHAKMIFYNAGLDPGSYWSAPFTSFAHADYPELIPILAAQVAHLAGYWNEYLPKLSLVALLLPALLCLISMFRGKWWQMFLLAPPLLFTLEWLKNGYMDGYLALYAGLALFFFGRWLDNRSRLDLASGIVLSGVVLDLKNEGMLFALIIAALLLLFVSLGRSARSAARQTIDLRVVVVSCVAISGTLLWGWKKHLAHVHNDLQLGIGSLGRISERLGNGDLYRILKYLYVTDDVNLSFGILLLCLVSALALRIRPSTGFYFCALAGSLYFCGIVLIYLGTPCELFSFHLPTGNRTMLPVHLMLLAASFSVFLQQRRGRS
jgi:hypothetical protein